MHAKVKGEEKFTINKMVGQVKHLQVTRIPAHSKKPVKFKVERITWKDLSIITPAMDVPDLVLANSVVSFGESRRHA